MASLNVPAPAAAVSGAGTASLDVPAPKSSAGDVPEPAALALQVEALRRELQAAKQEATAAKIAYMEVVDERDALKQLQTSNRDAMTSLGRHLESVMVEKGVMKAELEGLRSRYAVMEHERAVAVAKVKQLSSILADMKASMTAANEAGAASGASADSPRASAAAAPPGHPSAADATGGGGPRASSGWLGGLLGGR